LILGQRFASRFQHPHTFEHDRFKIESIMLIFLSAAPAVTRA
jgi:hypothetical protein